MYIITQEDKKNIKAEKFSIYKKPYTKDEKTLARWAYYVVSQLKEESKITTVGFSKVDEGQEPEHTLNHLPTFVNRIRSYYDNSWNGSSLSHISALHGGDNALPARFLNYPLMRKKVDWAQGKYESAPIDMNLAAIDKESVDKKIKKRTKYLFLKMLKPFLESIEQQTGTQLEEDKGAPIDPSKMDVPSYKLYHETRMSKLVEYNFYKHSWFAELSKGFKDTFLYGFTFMSAVPVNERDIRIRKHKLDTVIFDWNCESDYGVDAMFFGWEGDANLSNLLSENTVETKYAEEIRRKLSGEAQDGGQQDISNGSREYVKETNLLWKASRTHRVKKIPNKYLPGKFIYKILEEGEEPKGKKDSYEIIELDIEEWYQAVVIEDDIIIKAEPIYAPRHFEDPTSVLNPFVAMLFNRMDTTKPNGYGEMIIPVQELFNEVAYLLDLEIATSPGKVVEYDIRSKPKGVPITDIFYHMKANKIVQTDSKTGRSGLSTADLTPAAAQIYINILMFLEGFIDRLTGITDLAQGQVPRDTYVGTLSTAIAQSDFTTKPIFTFYREGVRRLFKSASNYLRELNMGKTDSLAIVIPTQGVEYFNMDGNIPYGDYDFFHVDGTEAEQKRRMLIDLGQVALNAGATTFKDIKTIILEKDMNEVSKKLDESFAAFDKRQQEASQIEQQLRANKDMLPEKLLQLKGQIDLLIQQQKGSDNLNVAEKYAQEGMREKVLEDALTKGKA